MQLYIDLSGDSKTRQERDLVKPIWFGSAFLFPCDPASLLRFAGEELLHVPGSLLLCLMGMNDKAFSFMTPGVPFHGMSI